MRTDSSQIGLLENLKTGQGKLHENDIQYADGSYLITATDATGRKYEKMFGYLTNGHFMDESQYLIVKPDTILFKR